MFLERIFNHNEMVDNKVRLHKAIDFIEWNKRINEQLNIQRKNEDHLPRF